MKQTEVMDLLKEAALPDCAEERRIVILDRLKTATCHVTNDQAASMAPGQFAFARDRCLLMIFWFEHTMGNAPHCLPGLFPLFASICGDRARGDVTCNVDWSLMPAPPPTTP